MSYPGGRTSRLSTTLTEGELEQFVMLADQLDATKSDLLRQLVLIVIGAPELQPAVKEELSKTLLGGSR